MAALTATLRADITQFERALTQAETKVTGLQRSTAQTNRELAKFGNEFGGATLIRQANLMAKAVEDIGGVTKLTATEQKRLAASVDEALTKYRALGQEVPPSLVKISSELTRIDKANEEAARSAAHLAEQQKRMLAEQKFGFEQAGGAASTLRNVLGSVAGSIAGAFTVGAIVNFSKQVVALGGEITDLSQRTGLSIEAVQEFKYAADQTGSSIETFAGAVTKLSDKIASGDKGAAKAVKDLGLSLAALRASSPEEAFTQIADAIGQIPDPMEQTRLALDLFGKSGAEVLPAIKAGFSDLREEARLTGQVISKEDVAALDEFGDRFDRLMHQLKVSAATAGVAIGDALTSGWQRFLHAVDEGLRRGPAGFGQGFMAAAMGQRAAENASQTEIEKGLARLARMDAAMGIRPKPESSAAVGPDEDELKRRAEAAKKYAEQIRLAVEKANGTDVQRQIKLVRDAYDALSAAERQNTTIVRALLEPYEQLRQQARVLPIELERARSAFQKPIASRELFAGLEVGADGVARSIHKIAGAMPDLQRETVQARNLLNGLTEEGLIPASRSFAGLATSIDAAKLKGTAVTGVLVEAKTETFDLRDGLEDLSRAFADLAQISPTALDGALQDFAEFVALANVAAAAGAQLSAALKQIGKGGAANVAGGLIGGLSGAVGAVGALGAATNVAGRGNRAARGAVSGGAFGFQVGGPFGALAGAGIGALVGALRNPAFEDVGRRVRGDFGVDIPESLARAIADQAKGFKGDRATAEIANFAGILGAAGGPTSENLERFSSKLRDVFSFLERGQLTVAQTRDVIDQSFGAMAAAALEDGGLLTEKLREMIALDERFGTQSAAIADVVRASLTSGLGHITTFLDHAKVSSESSAAAIAAAIAASFEKLGGDSEAIAAAESAVAALQAQLEAAGYSGGAAFDALRERIAFAKDELAGPAITAIQALGGALTDLYNGGVLTGEQFAAIAGQITATRAELIAQGKDGSLATKAIQRELQVVYELQQRFGVSLDDSTQALLDEARAAGIVGDKFKSAQDRMADAAERTADAVEALATAFGYIPKAAELAADGATRALNRIPKNVAIDVNYRTPDVIMGPNGEEIPIGGGSGREGVWNPTGEVIGGPGGDQVVVGSPRRDAPFVAPVAAPSSAPIVVNTSVVGTVDGRVLLRFVSTELPRYVETITGQRVTA